MNPTPSWLWLAMRIQRNRRPPNWLSCAPISRESISARRALMHPASAPAPAKRPRTRVWRRRIAGSIPCSYQKAQRTETRTTNEVNRRALDLGARFFLWRRREIRLLVQAVRRQERPFQGAVDWSGGLIRKLFYGSVAFVVLSAVACAQEWQRLGPEGGMVISLAGGAGGNVYLGVSDGHVFGSDDAARHWELRGRVGKRTDAVVSRMVVDPRDAKRVFAAVWYQEAGAGGGVFKSEDAGQHWRLLGLKAEAVRALEIAPENPDMLVAGTRSGVFV